MHSIKVIFTRGLPASGKSTWVNTFKSQHSNYNVCVLSYDDFRKVEPFASIESVKEREKQVKAHLLKRITECFEASDPVHYIILDNTNLSEKTTNNILDHIQDEGERLGVLYEFEIRDEFLDVPLLECIIRDSRREEDKKVGVGPILRLNKNAKRLRQARELRRRKRYNAQAKDRDWSSYVQAIIVDLDGTAALKSDSRGYFDNHLVREDECNHAVREAVLGWSARQRQKGMGPHHMVFFLSGRENITTDDGRTAWDLTSMWLHENGFSPVPYVLHLRDAGDHRPDVEVKRSMYYTYIAPMSYYDPTSSTKQGKYNIHFVLDDRDSVVNLWRNELGLPTFQVSNGDF